MAEKLNILQVNTDDSGGGAQKIARGLFQTYRTWGHDSWLAVSYKTSSDPDILPISHGAGRFAWTRFWWSLHHHCQSVDLNGRLSHWLQRIAEPQALLDYFQGVEDFNYPGTWRLLTLPGRTPDILHCHNLHGDYFDLRALSWLSRQLPTIVTLHDAWLLSGHCAHSLDCERWRLGCGECPDLRRYPAVWKDATAYNWSRKQEIFGTSRLYVATPSLWLMNKVKESMLSTAVIEARVIPNGIDLEIFRPQDRMQVRSSLKLSQQATILLFAANGIRNNMWKDFQTLREAIAKIPLSANGGKTLFIALGENASQEQLGQAEIRFIPHQANPQIVASYYQAADLYIHAAKADTFPNTILEALACGTPVVATAVGGIPEQIKGLRAGHSALNQYSLDTATGLLISPGSAEDLAAGVQQLLENENGRMQMSRNAVADARQRFSLAQQANAYVEWYREMLASIGTERSQAMTKEQKNWEHRASQ